MPEPTTSETDRNHQRELAGKVAVVTGGGGGIGRACAERLARDGADVVIADLPGKDEPIADGNSVFVPTDISDPAQARDLIEQAISRFGQVDVVVTAAGILSSKPGGAAYQDQLLDLPLDAWQRVLDVNLTGTMLVVQRAAQHMVERKAGGSIITISSAGAVVPGPGIGPYCVSKAGVLMLTKCLAGELGPHGIRVNTVAPGLIDTSMSAAITADAAIADAYVSQLPLGRIGLPEDVAGVVRHLAGEDSSYVTGKIHFVDGGAFTG